MELASAKPSVRIRLWLGRALRSTALKHLVVFLFFFTLAFIACRSLYFSPGIPIPQHGEWDLPPFSGQVEEIFERKLTSWTTDWALGVPRDSLGGMWYFLIPYSLASLRFSGDFLSWFLSMFLLALGGYCAFILGRQLKLSTLPSVLAGLFYMLTPYVYVRLLIGHHPVLFAYVLMPLVLAFFIKSLEGKQKFRWMLWTTIVMALASINERLFALVSLLLCLYFLAHIWGKGWQHIRTAIGNLAFIIIVSGAFVNLFWLSIANQLSYETASYFLGNLPIRFFRGEGFSLEYAFRLLDTRLGMLQEAAAGWPPWKILSFFPAVLAFATLLIRPKDKRVLFFSLLALLGIILASGPAAPLWGSPWIWLQEHISILNMFRDTSPFYPFACLGLAMLLGLLSESLRQPLLILLKGRIWLHLVTFIVISAIICSYTWPFFTGDFGGRMQTYHFGEEYEETYQWFSENPEDFRVLPMPGPYGTVFLDPPTFSAHWIVDPMALYPGKPTIVTARPRESRIKSFLFKTAYERRTEHLGDLLGLVNVKYIVFDANKRHAATDDYRVQVYFPEEEYSNEKLTWTLEHQKDIELLSTKGRIQIFRNSSYQPHIFPIDRVGLLAGDLDALVSLSYMEDLELRATGLIFVNQLSPKDLGTLSQLSNVSFLIQDGHYADLVLAAASREKYELNFLNYIGTTSPEEGWSLLKWYWRNWYFQAQLEYLGYTLVPSTLSLPYSLEREGNYQIYLKLYFGPSASTVKVYCKDTQIAEVQTQSLHESFRWVNLGPIHLPAGEHTLSLESNKGGDAFASVVIVPEETVRQAEREVADLIQDKPVMLLSELNSPASFIKRWSLRGDDLAKLLAEGGRRFPKGSPYSIEVQDDRLAFQLTFGKGEHDSFGWQYVIDPPFSLTEDMMFEFSYKLSDPHRQELRVFCDVDYDGDDKVDVWLRLLPGQGEPRVHLREDGIYDVTLYYAPTDLKEYHRHRVYLGNALRQLFPDKEDCRVMGLRIGFTEMSQEEQKTAEQAFTFYIKELSLKEIQVAGFPHNMGEKASAGVALSVSLPGSTLISQTVYIPQDGVYQLFLRGSSENEGAIAVVSANGYGSEFEVSLSPPKDNLQYYDVGEVYLPQGATELYIQSEGDRIFLDQLLITQPLPPSEPKVELSCQKLKSARYEISVKAEEPFYLFFSERYHPLWSLSLPGGEKLKSYPGYSFGNLFFVDRIGNFQMTLEYENQKFFDIGLPVSFSTMGLMLLLALMPSRWLRLPRRKRGS